MTKVLMCLFIVCETKFTIDESRTISHANETQAQQVQNLAQEDFPPKLLWNENADFKFSVNNEGEDVNKKPVSVKRRLRTRGKMQTECKMQTTD